MILIIMALNLYIPIVSLIGIFVFLITLSYYFKNRYLKYLVLMTIFLILSSLSLLRINRDRNRSYNPLGNSLDLRCDIRVSRDSSRVNKGFISQGVIYNIYNHQFSSNACLPVTLFSKVDLYKGDRIINKVLVYKSSDYSCKIDRSDLIENRSGYYLLRKRCLKSLLEKINSPLLQALLLGKKNMLTPEVTELFRITGCSHILALSGFHVGVIVILALTVFCMFFRLEISYIVTIIFLICYVLLTGVTPSLSRSIIMFVIAVVLKIKFIRISLLHILFLTFYVSIIIFPGDYSSLSFQLSYIALWGIIVISKEILVLPGFKRFPSIIRIPLSVSLSAMFATSYICYPVFGELYPVGVIASLIITPVVTIFIWIGILSFFIPKLDVILSFGEIIIYKAMNWLSRCPPVNESSIIYSFVPFILFIIPVILLILKIYRRLNAGRFNIKFKL